MSHDFILQQSNLPYLTNQKAADIVINQAEPPDVTLKNNNQADTKLKQNGDTKSDTNMDLVDNKDDKSDTSVKKQKKKKKKKHKKEVD